MEQKRDLSEKELSNLLVAIAIMGFPETIEEVEEAEREYQEAIDRGEHTPMTDDEIQRGLEKLFRRENNRNLSNQHT